MPYQSRDDLPENVRSVLPGHAQDMYKEAFNSAHEQYADAKDRRGGDDRETVAHKVAWSAVKEKYEKGDNDTWRSKGEQ